MIIDIDSTEQGILQELLQSERDNIRSGETSYGRPEQNAEMVTILQDLEAKIARAQ